MLDKTYEIFFKSIKPAASEAESDLLLSSQEIAEKIENHTGDTLQMAQIDTLMREHGYECKAVKQGPSFKFAWMICTIL